MIVDCKPGVEDACGGSHQLIRSAETPATSCAWDEIGPWDFCAGDIMVGGGCSQYETDATAQFVCDNAK